MKQDSDREALFEEVKGLSFKRAIIGDHPCQRRGNIILGGPKVSIQCVVKINTTQAPC